MPFFYGLRKFCDPKGQWNTINIHWRVILHNCTQCFFLLPSCLFPVFPSTARRWCLQAWAGPGLLGLSSIYISDICPNQLRLHYNHRTNKLLVQLTVHTHLSNHQPMDVHEKRQAQDKKSKVQSRGQANTNSTPKQPSWWSLAELKEWKTTPKPTLILE